MKNIFVLIALILTFSACKDTQKPNDTDLVTTTNSNLTVYKGEFIYTADAAVLKGKDFIYGVTIDAKMQELATKVAKVKKGDFDMVPVIVTGTLAKKPEGKEGWDEILTIIDIVQVSDKPAKADVKIEDVNSSTKKTKEAIKKEAK